MELLKKLESMEVPVATLATDAVHCHALIRVDEADAKQIFGRAKQASSFALTEEVSGKLWGAASRVTRVGGFAHFLSVADYIGRHGARGAWVWVREDVMQRLLQVRSQKYARSEALKTQPRRRVCDVPEHDTRDSRNAFKTDGPP